MSNTFKVVVALVMLALILPSLSLAFDAGIPNQHLNESLTVNYTSDYTVSAQGRYRTTIFDNETVVDTTPPRVGTLSEGTDYDFFTTNGTLRLYNTPATDSGDGLYISYNATTPTEEQQSLAVILAVVSVGVGIITLGIAFSYTMHVAGFWVDSK